MTKKTLSAMARKRIPKIVWGLVDRNGDVVVYDTREQAEDDAWGPRFRQHEIRAYKLVPKSQQPKRKDGHGFKLGSDKP